VPQNDANFGIGALAYILKVSGGSSLAGLRRKRGRRRAGRRVLYLRGFPNGGSAAAVLPL